MWRHICFYAHVGFPVCFFFSNRLIHGHKLWTVTVACMHNQQKKTKCDIQSSRRIIALVVKWSLLDVFWSGSTRWRIYMVLKRRHLPSQPVWLHVCGPDRRISGLLPRKWIENGCTHTTNSGFCFQLSLTTVCSLMWIGRWLVCVADVHHMKQSELTVSEPLEMCWGSMRRPPPYTLTLR